MPLIKSSSKSAREKNIAEEIKSRKKPSQEVAIGYSIQDRAKAKPKARKKK